MNSFVLAMIQIGKIIIMDNWLASSKEEDDEKLHKSFVNRFGKFTVKRFWFAFDCAEAADFFDKKKHGVVGYVTWPRQKIRGFREKNCDMLLGPCRCGRFHKISGDGVLTTPTFTVSECDNKCFQIIGRKT